MMMMFINFVPSLCLCLKSMLRGVITLACFYVVFSSLEKLSCDEYNNGESQKSPKKTKKWKSCDGNHEKLKTCSEKKYELKDTGKFFEDELLCHYRNSTYQADKELEIIAKKPDIVKKWRKSKEYKTTILDKKEEWAINAASKLVEKDIELLRELHVTAQINKKEEVMQMLLSKVDKTLEEITEFGRMIDEKRKNVLVEFEDVINSEDINVATIDPNYYYSLPGTMPPLPRQ